MVPRCIPDAVAVLTVALLLAAGCGETTALDEGGKTRSDGTASRPASATSPGGNTRAPREDREPPASSAAAETAPEDRREPAVPPRAKLSFDELKPDIAPPQNRAREQDPPPEALEAVARGKKLKDEKDFPGAVEQFQRALGFDPGNPEIHRLLALSYVSMRNLGKGLQHLRKAEEYAGNNILLQTLMGRLCRINKQPDKALIHYRTALLCDDAAEKPVARGEVLLRLARLLAAEGYLTASLECYGKLENRIGADGRKYIESKYLKDCVLQPELLMKERGGVLLKLGRPRAALELLVKAWKRNRSDSQTARYYFDALVSLERFDEAEKALLDIIAVKSHGDIAPDLAYELCIASQDAAAPARIWKQYIDRYDISAPIASSLARAAIELGDRDGAREILDELVREMPRSRAGAAMLADLSVKAGNYRSALALLVGLVSRDSSAAAGVGSTVKKIASEGIPRDTCAAFSRSAYEDTTQRRFAMHYVAGLLWAAMGDHLKAADHYRRSIEENRSFIPAYEAFFDAKRYLKSREDIRAVLDDLAKDISTGNHLYHYLQGKVYMGNWRFSRAAEEFEKARKKSPDHIPTLLGLAEALELQARYTTDLLGKSRYYKQAIDVLSDAATMERSNLRIYELIVNIAAALRRKEQLVEVASRLRRTMADNPAALALAAEANLKAGNKDAALEIISRLRASGETIPAIRYLPILAEIGGPNRVVSREAFEKARAELDAVVEAYPDFFDARKLLAFLWEKPGGRDYRKAAAVWQAMRDRKPGSIHFMLGHVLVLQKAGEYDAALELLSTLLDISPDNARFKSVWVGVLLEAGRVDEALDKLTSWIEQTERPVVWRKRYLSICAEKNKPRRGLAMLRSIENGKTELSASFLERAKIRFFIDAKQFAEALAVVDGMENKLGAFGLRLEIAGDMIEADARADALALIEKTKIPQVNVSDWQQKASIGMLQVKLRALAGGSKKELKKAADAVAAVLEKHPAWVEAIEVLMWACQEADAYDAGIATFREWSRKEWRAVASGEVRKALVAKLRIALGTMLMRAGKLDESLSVLEKAADESPGAAEVWNVLATVLGELGRMDDSLAALEKAWKLDSADASYCNNLAYSLAVKNVEIDRAERLSRQALKKETPVAYMDTLAWILYKQGKLEEAASLFASFLDYTPEESPRRSPEEMLKDPSLHPVLWDHAGDVFYRLGWREASEQYWEHALEFAELNKKHERVLSREIREILEHTSRKLKSLRAGTPVEVAPLAEQTGDDEKNTPAGEEE